jgi:phytoene dehydrogenase-like protein
VTIQVDASLPAYIDRLSRRFPSERRGIAAFFQRAGAIYDAVEGMMDEVKTGKAHAGAFPAALLQCGHLTYADLLQQDIRDAQLSAILSDRCPFLGSPPAKVSATRMVALVMSYFRSGAYRPAGGHQRLPDLLVEGIRRARGEVWLGRPATRILLEGGAPSSADDGAEFPRAMWYRTRISGRPSNA